MRHFPVIHSMTPLTPLTPLWPLLHRWKQMARLAPSWPLYGPFAQHICCSFTGSADLLQDAFFNKFQEVAVRCTFRHSQERLVLRVSDPPRSFEVDQSPLLAIVEIQRSDHLFCQPVPPDRGHKLAGPFLEIRRRKTGIAAAFAEIS